MKECMVCQMINGEEPCQKIKENDEFMAIYNTSSRFAGHTFVFPKNHTESYNEIENIMKFYQFVNTVHSDMIDTNKYTSTKLILKNGKEAGQMIKHIYFEIIPYE